MSNQIHMPFHFLAPFSAKKRRRLISCWRSPPERASPQQIVALDRPLGFLGEKKVKMDFPRIFRKKEWTNFEPALSKYNSCFMSMRVLRQDGQGYANDGNELEIDKRSNQEIADFGSPHQRFLDRCPNSHLLQQSLTILGTWKLPPYYRSIIMKCKISLFLHWCVKGGIRLFHVSIQCVSVQKDEIY